MPSLVSQSWSYGEIQFVAFNMAQHADAQAWLLVLLNCNLVKGKNCVYFIALSLLVSSEVSLCIAFGKYMNENHYHATNSKMSRFFHRLFSFVFLT